MNIILKNLNRICAISSSCTHSNFLEIILVRSHDDDLPWSTFLSVLILWSNLYAVNLAAEFYLVTPKIGMCIILVYFEALNLHQFSIPIYWIFGFKSSVIVVLILSNTEMVCSNQCVVLLFVFSRFLLLSLFSFILKRLQDEQTINWNCFFMCSRILKTTWMDSA